MRNGCADLESIGHFKAFLGGVGGDDGNTELLMLLQVRVQGNIQLWRLKHRHRRVLCSFPGTNWAVWDDLL